MQDLHHTRRAETALASAHAGSGAALDTVQAAGSERPADRVNDLAFGNRFTAADNIAVDPLANEPIMDLTNNVNIASSEVPAEPETAAPEAEPEGPISEMSRKMDLELGNAAKGLSQRTLNAIEPESVVPIHRHQKSSETVVCLRGRLVVEFYDVLERRCIETQELSPNGALIALNITEGQWHTVRALESGTVVLLVKDGRYEAIKQTLVYTNGHYELVRN